MKFGLAIAIDIHTQLDLADQYASSPRQRCADYCRDRMRQADEIKGPVAGGDKAVAIQVGSPPGAEIVTTVPSFLVMLSVLAGPRPVSGRIDNYGRNSLRCRRTRGIPSRGEVLPRRRRVRKSPPASVRRLGPGGYNQGEINGIGALHCRHSRAGCDRRKERVGVEVIGDENLPYATCATGPRNGKNSRPMLSGAKEEDCLKLQVERYAAGRIGPGHNEISLKLKTARVPPGR